MQFKASIRCLVQNKITTILFMKNKKFLLQEYMIYKARGHRQVDIAELFLDIRNSLLDNINFFSIPKHTVHVGVQGQGIF